MGYISDDPLQVLSRQLTVPMTYVAGINHVVLARIDFKLTDGRIFRNIVASLVPARRAMTVDPMVALRYE